MLYLVSSISPHGYICPIIFEWWSSLHRVLDTPGRSLTDITVGQMLKLKLRGRDPNDVYACEEGLTVTKLLRKIQGRHNIGSQLVVSSKTGEPQGFLTESDASVHTGEHGTPRLLPTLSRYLL